MLARGDAGAAGSLSELQAGEIEKLLEQLAEGLVSGTPISRDSVAPDFRGTPLGPAAEELARSQDGLETFRGTPPTDPSITPSSRS